MDSLPKKITLYKKKGTRLRVWSIWIELHKKGFILRTSHGLKNGKITKDAGKIIDKGKANRTLLEQVKLQFLSKLNLKSKEGYVTNKDGIDKNIIIPKPMLALEYSKHGHKLNWKNIIGQAKLDGIRCLAKLHNCEIHLKTRKGNDFPGMENIKEILKKIKLDENIILDGELYSKSLPFRRITGLVRKSPKKMNTQDLIDSDKISLYVFDMIDLNNLDMPFSERYTFIKTKLKNTKFIKIVPIQVVTKKNVNQVLEKYVNDGYEGLMLRNKKSPYQIEKRTADLQKYKKFYDDEFKIIDYKEGTGNDKGTIIWVCKSNKSNTNFKVRPIGTRAERQTLFNNAEKYIGTDLTVKYQELSSNGIPRFPVGIAIRNYE